MYVHDVLGDLVSVWHRDGTRGIYDENGTVSRTYDGANRLHTYNGEEVLYDADGNMTYGPVNGVMGELVYDCRNRLISAGGVTYLYDPENVRTSAETEEYKEFYITDL